MIPVELSRIANGDLLAFAAPVTLLLLVLWLGMRDADR